MIESQDSERRWEHWLVHLLWAVSVRTSAQAEVALSGSPLTLAGLGMLENITANPGITIAQIARTAPQTQQALSQISARLERLGLIERRLADRGRGVALHLTPAGTAAHRQGHDTTEAFEQQLQGTLGPTRHRRLVALLEEMRTVLSDSHPPDRPAPGPTAPPEAR